MTHLMNVFKPIKNLKDVDKTCTYRKMNYKSSKLSLFFFTFLRRILSIFSFVRMKPWISSTFATRRSIWWWDCF